MSSAATTASANCHGHGVAGSVTAKLIAARGFIPISADFVPFAAIKAQWASYSGKREALGKAIDPAIWRVCRNILITESEAHAHELRDDSDGPFSFYFRYLRGLREMHAIRDMQAPTD